MSFREGQPLWDSVSRCKTCGILKIINEPMGRGATETSQSPKLIGWPEVVLLAF